MRLVDSESTRLVLFDQAELLWGTPGRQAEWAAYERRKLAELQEAFYDPRHPEHAATRKYIATYVYPMATCISPYRFESAQGLSVREIAEAYATLKLVTGSVIRGVGSLEEGAAASTTLTGAQLALLEDIHEAAIGLTFQCRVTMDSRDESPAFAEAIPGYAIRYTMVTKRDKLVLYPNSGRGAYFPAHGEAVLVRPNDPRQRTAVTVRPWWQIAGAPERYVPMCIDGRDEPFYFEEKRAERQTFANWRH